MLSALDLKLFRDLGKIKGQIIAVSLVMACGIASTSPSKTATYDV